MPSAFLVNAAVIFAGVIVFIAACFTGTFWRRTQPWRYRFILAPLGFVVAGGISISAQAHLLRWIQHGHLHHSLTGGLFQSATLLIAGCAGCLAGIGLGSSLDHGYFDALIEPVEQHRAPRRRLVPASDKIVPISDGRRQPGILPQVRAVSQSDQSSALH